MLTHVYARAHERAPARPRVRAHEGQVDFADLVTRNHRSVVPSA